MMLHIEHEGFMGLVKQKSPKKIVTESDQASVVKLMKLSQNPFGSKFHHSHESLVLALSSSVMGLASGIYGI